MEEEGFYAGLCFSPGSTRVGIIPGQRTPDLTQPRGAVVHPCPEVAVPQELLAPLLPGLFIDLLSLDASLYYRKPSFPIYKCNSCACRGGVLPWSGCLLFYECVQHFLSLQVLSDKEKEEKKKNQTNNAFPSSAGGAWVYISCPDDGGLAGGDKQLWESVLSLLWITTLRLETRGCC